MVEPSRIPALEVLKEKALEKLVEAKKKAIAYHFEEVEPAKDEYTDAEYENKDAETIRELKAVFETKKEEFTSMMHTYSIYIMTFPDLEEKTAYKVATFYADALDDKFNSKIDKLEDQVSQMRSTNIDTLMSEADELEDYTDRVEEDRRSEVRNLYRSCMDVFFEYRFGGERFEILQID
jgi:hypothetical protein